jgi:hypothetical protein
VQPKVLLLDKPFGWPDAVEMPQERYRHLQLQRGTQVFVTVKGLKVFTNAHSAMT